MSAAVKTVALYGYKRFSLQTVMFGVKRPPVAVSSIDTNKTTLGAGTNENKGSNMERGSTSIEKKEASVAREEGGFCGSIAGVVKDCPHCAM